jgi:hypothetical protein
MHAVDSDHPTLANILFWQNWALESLVHHPNLGTPSHPWLEGTPVDYLAYIASYPVGLVIYSFLGYFLFSRFSKAPKQLPDPKSPSVTPPAKTGGTPSVAADH